jgi:hypothetical protein
VLVPTSATPSPLPGEFLGARASSSSAPSIGLHRDFSGSALSCPPCGVSLTRLQSSLNAGGSTVAPPEGLSTLGSGVRAFPPDVASPLPGLLVATRPDF